MVEKPKTLFRTTKVVYGTSPVDVDEALFLAWDNLPESTHISDVEAMAVEMAVTDEIPFEDAPMEIQKQIIENLKG